MSILSTAKSLPSCLFNSLPSRRPSRSSSTPLVKPTQQHPRCRIVRASSSRDDDWKRRQAEREERISNTRREAALVAGLELEEFNTRLDTLFSILPDSEYEVLNMKPASIAALAVDSTKTIDRILQLKNMFPAANIETMLWQRPSLLLDEEWAQIPDGLACLRQHCDEDVIIDKVVSQSPDLLIISPSLSLRLVSIVVSLLAVGTWAENDMCRTLIKDVERTENRILQFQNMLPAANIESIMSVTEGALLICGINWKTLSDAAKVLKLDWTEEQLARMSIDHPKFVAQELQYIIKNIEKFGMPSRFERRQDLEYDDDQEFINPNVEIPHSSQSTNSKNSSLGGGTSKNVAPWTLMGRVISEDKIRPFMNQQSIQLGLTRSAAAHASGLELEEFNSRLDALLIVMPFLQERLMRMKPSLLAALANDVEKTAKRIIQLTNMLPEANVESTLSQRPSLVLDEEWEKIPENLKSLRKYYDDVAIAKMASAEPILLVENVERIFKELERLMPSLDVQTRIECLSSNPELTGAPTLGVVNLLLNQPSLMHSVASGTASLGPGAEFMSEF